MATSGSMDDAEWGRCLLNEHARMKRSNTKVRTKEYIFISSDSKDSRAISTSLSNYIQPLETSYGNSGVAPLIGIHLVAIRC